jgi:hypothetical protein
MVPAMAGPLGSVRPLVVALLTLALLIGINGFVGAIHSVHHLPAPVDTHPHGVSDDGQGQQDPPPAAAPDETCPVAAAALHLAASEIAALPRLDPAPADSAMGAARPQDAPRLSCTEPGSGRAPPSFRSLPS